jgi:lipoteichoic acid synthase
VTLGTFKKAGRTAEGALDEPAVTRFTALVALQLAGSFWEKLKKRVESSVSSGRPDRTSHMFAGFLGLATLMLAVRFMILKHPPLRQFLPILAYQDILACTVVAWMFHLLLKLPLKQRSRQSIVAVGWCTCALLAGYTAISAIAYTQIHAPLTYGLFLESDGLRGAKASLRELVSSSSGLTIAQAFVIFVGVSEGLWRLSPDLVERARARFYSPAIAFLCLAYFFAAHAWTVGHVRYTAAVANPELAFISSLFTSSEARVTDVIPKEYFSDFVRNPKDLGAASGLSVSYSPLQRSSHWHPRNVLMIIMESVGSPRLQIYNAPHKDTPEMLRLSRNAMVFNRIYVAQAYTSAAMSALFCSLYPQFGWKPISRSAPEINVPGLADILLQHGYATAFLHSGQLDFDHEDEFLRHHGFGEVVGKNDDAIASADGELLSQATAWIRSHSKAPFFLALWTQDTHHPYFADTAHDYGVSDPNLNRYLNAVHSTDALIGQLTDVLDKMGLGDDTLVVITGDHGEAFGEHGQNAHNWTVYDEEMRVPLLLVNRRMFSREERVDRLGRQIDIAPTILALLGYDQPSSWQGNSLFSADAVDHAYLFSRYGNYTFGLVDNHFKYVYDFNRDRAELYDLPADRLEMRDLSSDPAYSTILKRDHLSIEAWMVFQTDYLRKYEAKN